MTILPIYSGSLKRDVVQLAFEECGQAGYEFELTPEEYDSALRRLNALLSDWKANYGIDLGFNFPPPGSHGLPDEESGLNDEDVNVVASALARRIAPSIGKTLPAEARAEYARAFQALRTRLLVIPTMQMRGQTIRGAGNRYRFWGPYFLTSTSAGENQ